MSAAAWIACGLMAIDIGLLFVIAALLDRAERAEKHMRWLSHQADELRQDYGSQIAQSRRMAMRLLDRDAS